jgi:acylphosphatase
MQRRVHLVIEGLVQGVFYRVSTRDQAVRRGLTGWVRNLADGSVECVAEGEEGALQALVAWCREGPSGARVTRVAEAWSDAAGEFDRFRVSY